MPNCMSCKHSHTMILEGARDLECRRNPPQIAAIAVPTPKGIEVQALTIWPTVQGADSCGEFEDSRTQSERMADTHRT